MPEFSIKYNNTCTHSQCPVCKNGFKPAVGYHVVQGDGYDIVCELCTKRFVPWLAKALEGMGDDRWEQPDIPPAPAKPVQDKLKVVGQIGLEWRGQTVTTETPILDMLTGQVVFLREIVLEENGSLQIVAKDPGDELGHWSETRVYGPDTLHRLWPEAPEMIVRACQVWVEMARHDGYHPSDHTANADEIPF